MTIESNLEHILVEIVPALQNRQHQAVCGAAGTHALSSFQRTPPAIIGLTGIQGSGKTTWATSLVRILRKNYDLRAIQVSLDDFYRTHEDLVKLREESPDNKLVRTRGQPGTHDECLARKFFQSLREQREGDHVLIPTFDKSRFNGEGDRAPTDEWPRAELPIDVIVFEGWCVGFQPLEQSVLKQQWELARAKKGCNSNPRPTETLADHALPHLITINENLERYCQTFMGPQHFDFFIQLDTDNLENVYLWRLQQEEALIRLKGQGLSEDEVVAFVRGYMPAYELYLNPLRRGFFVDRMTESSGDKRRLKRHFRIVQNLQRQVGHLEIL